MELVIEKTTVDSSRTRQYLHLQLNAEAVIVISNTNVAPAPVVGGKSGIKLCYDFAQT